MIFCLHSYVSILYFILSYIGIYFHYLNLFHFYMLQILSTHLLYIVLIVMMLILSNSIIHIRFSICAFNLAY